MKIKNINGKHYIFDIVRKKYLKLTPEEMVRQNFIKYLIESKGYLKKSMSLECGFTINNRKKRADLVVFDKEKPFLLVEFKSNKKPLNDKVIDQIFIYNIHIKALYLAITNGKEMIVLENKNKKYKQIKEIPQWRR